MFRLLAARLTVRTMNRLSHGLSGDSTEYDVGVGDTRTLAVAPGMRGWLFVVVAACSGGHATPSLPADATLPLPACAVDGCPLIAVHCSPVAGHFYTFQPTFTTDGCTCVPVEGACPDQRICFGNEGFPWSTNCMDASCSFTGCADKLLGCASDTVALHAAGSCDNHTCVYGTAVEVDCMMVDYVDQNHETYCAGANRIAYTGEHYCGEIIGEARSGRGHAWAWTGRVLARPFAPRLGARAALAISWERGLRRQGVANALSDPVTSRP